MMTTALPVVATVNFHAVFVMILVVFALFLFASEKIPLATSSLIVLVIQIIFFEVFPYYNDSTHPLQAHDFFSGFGHEALITVCALMIAGQGLVRTGALEPVGRYLAKQWMSKPSITFLQTLLLGAFLSAFVNNTPIVILLLPILISVSLHTNANPSKILMPMGFASIIGGMSTTIGTSTNLLVVSVAADLGMKTFSMFDFIVPAMIVGSVGILYLWLVVPKIITSHTPRLKNTSARLFLGQLCIEENTLSAGKTLTEVIKLTEGKIEVLQILRGKEKTALTSLPDILIKPDDRLVVRDTPENLKSFENALGAKLYAGDDPVDEDHPLKDPNQQIAEVVVIPGSTLDGRTLNNVRFTDRYHLLTLAIHRVKLKQNEKTNKHPEDIALSPGDVVLVQGSPQRILDLKMSRNFLVLDATLSLPRSDKIMYSIIIMAMVILPAAFGLLPISITAVTGVLLLLLTGCLTWKDASRSLSIEVILLIVTSLALGAALVQTGGADFIAQLYVQVTQGLSAQMIISGLLFLMMVLTNVVSNNAAAVIGTPIAVSIAHQLDLPPEPFVLAVLFGANMSFATPMAYQTNLLVMNAGNYSFWDFVRIGAPLALIMWLILSFLLPYLYGF